MMTPQARFDLIRNSETWNKLMDRLARCKIDSPEEKGLLAKIHQLNIKRHELVTNG